MSDILNQSVAVKRQEVAAALQQCRFYFFLQVHARHKLLQWLIHQHQLCFLRQGLGNEYTLLLAA